MPDINKFHTVKKDQTKLCIYRQDTYNNYVESNKASTKKKNKLSRPGNLPASHLTIESAYDVVFFFSKASMFDVWSEIIKPS